MPAPLLGIRPQGEDWRGGSHFFTDYRVSAYELKLVESGPASLVYQARYRFAPDGEYCWRLRLSDELSYAMIDEEFDFGGKRDGRDFLLLDLNQGWHPSEARILDSGGGDGSSLRKEPLAPYLENKSHEVIDTVKNVTSFKPPAPPYPGSAKLVYLEHFTTTGAYGPSCGFGLADAKHSLLVLPMHAGGWRRAMALTSWQDPERGVQVALPISVRPQHWYLECTDDRSPFSHANHDPNLPASYGRREWALCVDVDDPIALHARVGYVGLDRYKNWVLDWPEERAKAVYPRVFTTPALLARIKQSLDQHPEKALPREAVPDHRQTGKRAGQRAGSAAAVAQSGVSRVADELGLGWVSRLRILPLAGARGRCAGLPRRCRRSSVRKSAAVPPSSPISIPSRTRPDRLRHPPRHAEHGGRPRHSRHRLRRAAAGSPALCRVDDALPATGVLLAGKQYQRRRLVRAAHLPALRADALADQCPGHAAQRRLGRCEQAGLPVGHTHLRRQPYHA